MKKVILIHGNGHTTGNDAWLPYVAHELRLLGLEVLNPDFPEPLYAPASVWLPYLKNALRTDENTILIGHSSGAVAALRYAEQNKIHGSVLVAACYTDLGLESERKSGYYNTPWNWSTIKENQNWIIQFASKDDPFIPIEEARYIHEKLDTEYYEYENEAHFGYPMTKLEFPALIEKIQARLLTP